MSEWQPIKTAPWEQWVLVTSGKYNGVNTFPFVAGLYGDFMSEKGQEASWFALENGNRVEEKLTHWMPLPDPPDET